MNHNNNDLRVFHRPIRCRLVWFFLALLFSVSSGAAAWVDVSDSVSVQRSRPLYNFVTKTSYLDAWLVNGPQQQPGELQLVIDSVNPASLTVSNADGVTEDGYPFYLFDGLGASQNSTKRRIELSNPNRLRFEFTTQVRALAENQAPEADAGPDQTVHVGDLVRLDGSGSSDGDGDLLTFVWEFTDQPAGSQATLSNPNAVTPTFVADIAGDYQVQLVVNDGQADSQPDSIVASTANSAPVADAGDDQTVPVGSLVVLDGIRSHDVDGDPLTYHWTFLSFPGDSQAEFDNDTVAMPSFTVDKAGTYVAQLIVNDGVLDSAADSIVVDTINSRPVADAGPDRSTRVDVPLRLDGSQSFDADGDPLSYRWSFTSKPQGSQTEFDDPTLQTPDFTPDLEGQYIIQLIVNDGELDSAPDTAVVEASVVADNQPPQIVSLPATQATQGELYSYDVDAVDPDAGDLLGYALRISPPGMSIDAATGLIQWQPNAAGGFSVSVRASDRAGLYAEQDFVVSVSAGPTLLPIGDRTVVLGTRFSTYLFAYDPDPDEQLTFSLDNAPDGMTLDPSSGVLTWSPNVVGDYPFTVRVTDRSGRFASQTAHVEVVPREETADRNSAPTLAPIADQTLVLGDSLAVQLAVDDPDGDAIAFSLPSAPLGMDVDGGGLLRWNAQDIGTFDVTVRAADPAGLAAFRSFTVIVLAGNQAPVAIDDTYTARAAVTLDVDAPGVLLNDFDPNGDTLTAVLVSAPERGDFTLDADGSFAYTPVDPTTVLPVLDADLAMLEAPAVVASSVRHPVTYNAYKAVDGDVSSSWYTQRPHAANEFFELRFQRPISVKALRLIDQPLNDVFDFTAGRFQLFAADGSLLFDSGEVAFPAPDRTTTIQVGSIEGVLRVLFKPTGFASVSEGGMAELQVIGDSTTRELDYLHQWSWTERPVNGQVLVADLNQDQSPELVFISNNGQLYALNGTTGATVFNVPSNQLPISSVGAPAIADLRPDHPGLEIVVAHASNPTLAIVDSLGAIIDQFDIGVRVVGGYPAIADLDGDGSPEIVVAGVDVSSATTVRLAAVRADGTVMWNVPTTRKVNGYGAPSAGRPIVADVDLDGEPEIIVGSAVYSAAGELKYENPDIGDGEVAVGNLDDDPYAEIVMARANTGIYVLEHDMTLKYGPIVRSGFGENLDIGEPAIGDTDGDGMAEIVVAGRAGITVLEADGTTKWTAPTQDVSCCAAPALFDFNNDGAAEVVYRDELKLYVFDGRTGAVQFSTEVPSSTFVGEYPVVADIDSDGQAEIVTSSNITTDTAVAGVHVFASSSQSGVRARPIWNQHSYHVSNVHIDGSVPAHELPNWLIPDQNNFHQNTFLPDEQQQLEQFTYRANDGELDSNDAVVTLAVRPPNTAPRILSNPVVVATRGIGYLYGVSATDAEGGPLTFSLTAAPVGMTIDPVLGLIRWLPDLVGDTQVSVAVTDSEGFSAVQVYDLGVSDPVVVPDVVGLAQTDAESALSAARLATGHESRVTHPTVPADQVVSQLPKSGSAAAVGSAVDLILSLGPAPADADDDGDGFSENQGDCNDGNDSVYPGAADPAGDGIDQDCNGIDGNLALQSIQVTPADPLVLVGEEVVLHATGIFEDGSAQDLTDLVNWSAGSNHYVPAAAGDFEVTASRNGTVGSTTVSAVSVTADDIPPIALITSPAAGDSITAPVEVTGSAVDPNLLKYELAYARAGDANFTVFDTGLAALDEGVLGRFDPTMLINDQYTLRLTVYDKGGNQTIAERTVTVDGNLKVGNFTLRFTDLSIPMSGLPISVVRTYDSRDRRSGDFGVGWHLDVQTLRLSSNRVLGGGWYVARAGLSFALQAESEHKITITLPGGRVEEFDMQVNPRVSALVPFPPFTQSVTFRPRIGTRGQLESLDGRNVSILDPQPGSVSLLDDVRNRVFDPQRFRYTAADGTQFVIDKVHGVEQVVDPNGNTLTFTVGGILHSSGKSLVFDRDEAGRIVRVTDPMGNVQRYNYDSNGDLREHTDAAGNAMHFDYDRLHGLLRVRDPLERTLRRNEYADDGRLVSTTGADGRVISFDHQVGAREEVVTDADGSVTVFEYDTRGNVLRMTDALGNITSHVYDDQDNQVSSTDALGNVTMRSFDERGNKLSETDPLGGITTYVYDAAGRVTKVSDALGLITEMTYDTRGNLVAKVDALGQRQSSAYDVRGNLVAHTNALGATIQNEYDAFGNRVAQTDARGNRSTSSYDANGNVVAVVDRLGFTTQTEFDERGLVSRRLDPLGNRTDFSYNVAGTLQSVTDAEGFTTTYESDALGRDLATTDALGNRVQNQFDARGRLVVVLDALGRRTTTDYDALDRRVATTSADGGSEHLGYDALGRIVTRTDARGNVSTIAYDALGRQVSSTDPLGHVVHYEYDAVGNRIRVTDAMGQTVAFEYDALGRRTRVVHPDGAIESTAYDAAGHVVGETDPLGRATAYAYDANGNLTSVTDPLGGVTRFSYDAEDRLVEQVDANGHSTRFAFDPNGRRISRTNPDGSAMQQAYTRTGQIASITDANGQVITFEHDGKQRVSRKLFADGTSVEYGYGATGRVEEVTTVRGRTRFSFDDVDRVVARENPDGSAIEYRYDAVGNLMGMTSRTSATAAPRDQAYAYDALNRLASVTDSKGLSTLYQYDVNGNLGRIDYSNGTSGVYTYDSRNRLMVLEHRQDAMPMERYTYQLDAVGNRLRVDRLDGSSSVFAYDTLRRLTHETYTDAFGQVERDLVYGYDAVANRLTQTDLLGGSVTPYVYDDADRLLSQGDTQFTYDANGNVRSRSVGNSMTLYAYDAENRLAVVARGTDVTRYDYDFDGHRSTMVDESGSTSFLVSAINATGFAQVLDEYGPDGIARVGYVYGSDLVSQQRNGASRWYHVDGTGSTRLLTDANGVVTDSYDYDAFGALQYSTGITPNRYLFSGEQLDANSGFYYLRARYYAAQQGRFISQDAYEGSGREPMSLHRYLYAYANPLSFADPSGNFTGTIGEVNLTAALGLGIGNVIVTYYTNNQRIGFWQGVRAFLVGATGAAGPVPATAAQTMNKMYELHFVRDVTVSDFFIYGALFGAANGVSSGIAQGIGGEAIGSEFVAAVDELMLFLTGFGGEPFGTLVEALTGPKVNTNILNCVIWEQNAGVWGLPVRVFNVALDFGKCTTGGAEM